MTRNQRNNFNVHAIMDVPEGAYAYAPGVGLGMAINHLPNSEVEL